MLIKHLRNINYIKRNSIDNFTPFDGEEGKWKLNLYKSSLERK